MKNQYKMNPLLEGKGFMKNFKQGGKIRNGAAAILKKTRKKDFADPMFLASNIVPVPGSSLIGFGYTRAIPKEARARYYKNIMEKPISSLFKAPIEVPRAAIKTTKAMPGVINDTSGKLYHDGTFYASHPKYALDVAKNKVKRFGSFIL